MGLVRQEVSGFLAIALTLTLSACASAPKPALPPSEVGSFGNFRPPADRIHFLACPQNYCAVRPDLVTALKSVRAEKLLHIVRNTLDAMPHAEFVSSANEGLRLVYHQIGSWSSEGATVTVEIIDADEGVSGIALYSESDDAGSSAAIESKRGRVWLAAIDRAAAAP